ncbi:hypothetical protein L915_04630, partial [Phytophthora nicotianae]
MPLWSYARSYSAGLDETRTIGIEMARSYITG